MARTMADPEATKPHQVRPGFQLQPSCDIPSYRGRSKSVQGVQYLFSYDLQRLTIQPHT